MGWGALKAELDELYKPCCTSHIDTITMADGNDDLIKKIHEGKISGKQLDYSTFKNYADKLMQGVEKGVQLGENPAANSMVAYLRNNIFAFSAAKTFTEQDILSKLLLRPDGTVKPYAEFKRDAEIAIKDFKTTYLQAEYNHAIAAAQMAEKWRTLQANKQNFPYLQYRTVRDVRVRDEHRELEGIILPIDSPVWDMIYPPNGWNCRCDVIPSKEGDKVADKHEVGKKGKEIVKPFFKTNVGKTGIVYDEGMPMYKNVKGKIQDLDPVMNYNLQVPDAKTLPILDANNTENDYKRWWDIMIKTNGTEGQNFAILDYDKKNVLFRAPDKGINKNLFKDHVLAKKDEERFKYIHNAADILQKPDEVFSQKYKGDLSTIYIKYYKATPVVIIVENKLEVSNAITMYTVTEKQRPTFIKKRRGVLLYKKTKN